MMTDPAASRPGTHLDPDQMADLFEGLLDTAAADEARAHLALCPLCSGDFALITGEADESELRELLPPAPIPQDVVVRIEAALHREPPLGTAAAAPIPSARPRRRRFRLTFGALAGATLVVAGGVGVLTAVNSGSSSKSSSSGSSAVAGNAPSSQSADGPHADGESPGGAMSPQVGAPASPAAPFKDLSIEQQALGLLGHHTASPATGTAQGGGPQCAPAGVANDTKPLASAKTEYQGRQAWLLIYPHSGSATLDDVYVVDLDSCTPGNTGQVLDHIEITHP